MQSVQSAEHRLKVQVFYLVLGLLMILAVLPFSEWFRYQGSPFSVLAVNAFSREEYLANKRKCSTAVMQSQGFACMCEKEVCGVLGRMHVAGQVFTTVLLVAIPAFICAGVNLNRKVRRLRMSQPQERSCFDWEISLYLGPLLVVGAFVFWVVMSTVNGPHGQENLWKEDFHIGQSFQNALFGLGVIIWGTANYYLSVKKAYTVELSMRNIYV